MRDLNTMYRGEPALHQQDFQPEGFAWADFNDAEQSVIGLFRKGARRRLILVACNFTPVPRHNYRFGVPGRVWAEILNSDATLYGGSGQGKGGVRTTPVAWHGISSRSTWCCPRWG